MESSTSSQLLQSAAPSSGTLNILVGLHVKGVADEHLHQAKLELIPYVLQNVLILPVRSMQKHSSAKADQWLPTLLTLEGSSR